MSQPTSYLERLIAAVLPPSLRHADEEAARPARLTFFFSLVICVAALSYSGLYVLLSMPLAATGAGFAIVGAPLALLALRKTESTTVAGHTLSAVVVAALVGVSAATGGIHSPALAWFILAPVITAMIVGRRAAIVWLPIVVAQFVAFWALDGRGVLPPSETPGFFDETYKFAVPTGLMLAFFAIAWSYEKARDRSMAALTETHGKLASARDAAERAHGEARLVLDNVAQGMMIVRADGRLEGGSSAVVAEWFGEVGQHETIWALVASRAPKAAAWLEASWEDLQSDWLPREMAIEQLPPQLALDDRTLRLEYRPLDDDEGQVLVVITDITAEIEAKRVDEAQRELMALFTRVLRDPKAVQDFLGEARRLVGFLAAANGTEAQEKRWLHTLKGNAALFGLNAFATWLHGLEDALDERGERLTPEERESVQTRWSELDARVGTIMNDQREGIVAVDREAFESTVAAAERGASGRQLAQRMRRWTWDRVTPRLELLAERGQALAERLDKPGIRFVVDSGELMHPPSPTWSAFWNATTHVLRNAVDHGVETADERLAAGKSGAGTVTLRAVERREEIVIEIEDDGAGIDWAAAQARAKRLGLPAETPEQLEAALFADGLSTRDTVSQLSGRGVGMAAVKEACEALDGSVTVHSIRGGGTTVRFCFPTQAEPSLRSA